jgi:PPOX class probable F420-dependent enzyme
MELDTTSEFGARVARRLRDELVIWLVTVGADGTPQPSVVWFLWDGADDVLVLSEPDTPKVANIARHPPVALHLDGDGGGGDVVVLTGAATVHDGATVDVLPDEYFMKYDKSIRRIGLTPETMAAKYSTAVHVAIGRVRGY